jgi:hypothetical protein
MTRDALFTPLRAAADSNAGRGRWLRTHATPRAARAGSFCKTARTHGACRPGSSTPRHARRRVRRLPDLAARAQGLVEQLAVAPQAQGVAGDGLRRGVVLAGDLAEAGALDQVMEQRQQQFGPLEPVGGAERLLGEAAPAVATAEPLDAVRGGEAAEEAGPLPAPRSRWGKVECAALVGSDRGWLEAHGLGHAAASLQPPHQPQSSAHNACLASETVGESPRNAPSAVRSVR